MSSTQQGLESWWKHAVIYQIYPRSFQDSNDDGIGDLEGIRRRLPYLVSLGVDAIWLSPIMASPMVDFGYDVSDYREVEPDYGSRSEFEELLQEAHDCGLRVILDLVPNHTSDQHQWFRESRSSRTSAKRDWYVWKEPAPDGGPPNNWLSAHGGLAWTFDEATGQYYLHSFQPEMPELNWENQEVRAEIYDVMRFWLGLGVDGFRVDVILRLAKERGFKDEPLNPAYRPGVDPEYNSLLHTHTRDVEHVHEYVREIRQVVDEYEDRVLIGETYLPVPALLRYYGNRDETHLPFNFGLITEPFETEAIMDYIEEYLATLPSWAWPNWVLGNHDTGRIAAEERAGSDGAAAAAILLCTLPGTITLYYGDELGMVNGEFTLGEMKDNLGRNNVGTALSRDRGRTPMQWDAGRNGGFSRGEPWLKVNPDVGERNVAAACADGGGLLSLYRRLIAFRRFRTEVVGGSVRLVADVGNVIGYEVGIPRAEGMPWLVEDSESMGWTVLLNISDEPVALSRFKGRRVELSSEVALERLPFSGTLAPGQAAILSKS